LLKRVFDIDIAQCPQCGGTLTIIAAIEDPPVIAKILTHLGLSARAPPRSPARSFDRLQMAFYEGPVVKSRRQIIFNLLWLLSSACAEKVSAGVIHALSTDEDFLSIVVGGQRVNNSGPSDQR
jgi:hypothetical protein